MKIGIRKASNGNTKMVILYLFFAIFNLILIFNSAKNRNLFLDLRIKISSILNPFLNLASMTLVPISNLQAVNEKADLKAEIEMKFLNVLIERDEVLTKNLKLFKKLIMEIKLDSYELILSSPNYYSSSGVLIDVVISTKNNYDNISVNSSVIGANGLFGRVSEVGSNNFNIIPIFHSSSRIPIYTKSSKIYAIAAGDGFEIDLIYPSDNPGKIIEEEEVLTSSENGLLISGIPVGKIMRKKDSIKIIPYVEKRPEILGIITSKQL
jgi:cell shape-determining protein MreC